MEVQDCIATEEMFQKNHEEMLDQMQALWLDASNGSVVVPLNASEKVLLSMRLRGLTGHSKVDGTCFESAEKAENALQSGTKELLAQENVVFEKINQARNLAHLSCQDAAGGNEAAECEKPSKQHYINARMSLRNRFDEKEPLPSSKDELLSLLKDDRGEAYAAIPKNATEKSRDKNRAPSGEKPSEAIAINGDTN